MKGQIPDFGYDIKMLSVVVDGEKSKTIPGRGLYKANVECSGGTTGEWDYNAWNLIINHAESNSKCNISFTSNLTQAEYDKYIEAGKALRRNTYRGKDISSYHQDGSLYEMISSGRFDDIYIGDYIVANNIKWLVADIDNYLYSGNTPLTKHHLTMIPAKPIINAAMNDTDTTEGGYLGSKMVISTLTNVLSTYVEPFFSGHVLTYNTLSSSLVSTEVNSAAGAGLKGASSNWLWQDRKIDLMSEANVYGTNIASSSIFDTGMDNRQYAIFGLKPEFIYSNGTGERFSYWLKNVFSHASFAHVHNSSAAGQSGASNSSYGVRPRFLIG